MISLQSLLNTGAQTNALSTENISYILIGVLVVCIAILALAFVVGMKKGVRKVGFGCCFWLVATIASGIAVSLCDTALNAIIAAVCCVAGSLVVCGVGAFLFRARKPKVVKVKDYAKDQYGFEYEYDDVDDLDVLELNGPDGFARAESRGIRYIVKGKSRPTERYRALSRISGGLVAALQAAAVLLAILCIGVLAIKCTTLNTTSNWGVVLNKKGTLWRVLGDLIASYSFDFLTVGILIGLAYKGYRVGIVGSTWLLVRKLGVLIAVIVGLAIPFVQMTADMYIFDKIIGRCASVFTSVPEELSLGDMTGGMMAGFAIPLRNICGRLLAGVFLAILFSVLVLCLSKLLKVCMLKVQSLTATRIIDGCIAVVIYLALGVVLCLVMWGVLYALDYYGLLKVSELFNSEVVSMADKVKTLSEACFEFVGKMVKGMLDAMLPRA